jgi:valyl-tRNA synthetase
MYRVLTEFLRLLHPFMPHLTEELSSRMSFPPRAPAGETKPWRKSQSLMNQRLGGPIGLSGSREEVASAQAATAAMYETVRAARNLRAEYQIATNKPAKFILRLPDEWLEDAGTLASIVRSLTRMINAAELTLAPDYAAPRGTPSARTPMGDLFMPLAGLVDLDAERARLEKELARAQNDLDAAERKLASEQFIANAPPAVVAEIRQRKEKALASIEKLRALIEGLGVTDNG